MNNKFRLVRPYGTLTVQGKEYFLLAVSPVVRDSWQLDTQQRWAVVPKIVVSHTQVDDNHYFPIYPCARHIVCTNPLIEYNVMHHILVLVAEEYDLSTIPMPEEDESDESGSWTSIPDVPIWEAGYSAPIDCSKWNDNNITTHLENLRSN